VEPTAEADPFESLLAAATRLVDGEQEALLVAASDGSRRPIGWLRARDVVRAAARDPGSLATLQVRSAMSACSAVCAAGSTPTEALEKMRRGRSERLAAVDGEGRLVGSVSLGGVASLARGAPQLTREIRAALAERSRAARRPPGGEVRDAMVSDVVACRVGEPLERVVALCYESDVPCLPVLAGSGEGQLAGISSAWDLCAAIVSRRGLGADGRVEEAMRDKVASCWPDDSLEAAEAIMRGYRVRRLPVVDTSHALVGVLSLSDVARTGSNASDGPQGSMIVETLTALSKGWGKNLQYASY
jgi:CBS domain-containing protein